MKSAVSRCDHRAYIRERLVHLLLRQKLAFRIEYGAGRVAMRNGNFFT